MRERKRCSAIGGALFWSTTTGEQGPTESFPSGPLRSPVNHLVNRASCFFETCHCFNSIQNGVNHGREAT